MRQLSKATLCLKPPILHLFCRLLALTRQGLVLSRRNVPAQIKRAWKISNWQHCKKREYGVHDSSLAILDCETCPPEKARHNKTAGMAEEKGGGIPHPFFSIFEMKRLGAYILRALRHQAPVTHGLIPTTDLLRLIRQVVIVSRLLSVLSHVMSKPRVTPICRFRLPLTWLLLASLVDPSLLQ